MLFLAFSLVAAAFAAPQGYDLGAPSGGGLSHGGSTDGVAGGIELMELRSSRWDRRVHPPSVPPPKVEHNILFVRVPEAAPAPDPIVVPPPRQNNVVYVLNKQEEQAQQVIEVTPHPAADPEIYFVNYQEGENPTLPLGVDLETALSVASAAGGDVIGDGGAGAGLGVGGLDGGAGAGGVGGFGGNGGFGVNIYMSSSTTISGCSFCSASGYNLTLYPEVDFATRRIYGR
ncbi:uncharacterized protein LOC122261446 [Penaeus japonicus]|uniref:uncharacterized protein LOC122261446 n=1 Tax=Penaeus japonicus TaxID=27405 RepID=UPI001C70E1C0|nr:uncharacterized protein LOC122261446 [Penaeus japonicus]